jgi:hypothetical protein
LVYFRKVSIIQRTSAFFSGSLLVDAAAATHLANSYAISNFYRFHLTPYCIRNKTSDIDTDTFFFITKYSVIFLNLQRYKVEGVIQEIMLGMVVTAF